MTDPKDTTETPTTESAAPEKPRRVRRTTKVEKEETSSTEAAPAAASPATPKAAARPRRTRTSADAEAQPATTTKPAVASKPAAASKPATARPVAPKRADALRTAATKSAQPKAAPPKRVETPMLAALSSNRSNKRTVYRQDVVGTPPVMPSPEPKKSPDQLMLVWHPAPKVVTPSKKSDKPLTAKEAMKAKLAKHAHPQGTKEAPKSAHAKPSVDAAWAKVGADGALDAARAAGDAGEALVQAWLDGNNVAAIVKLASLEVAPSVARKAARRAVNVLRSRGVSLETPAPVVAKPLATDAPSDCVASFIPPDGNGTTFYSFSQRLPGGRFRVADIMVRENAGIVHATLGHLAGKHIRRWKSRVEDSMGVQPIEVPLEWARFAVAEGRALNDRTQQILPLGFGPCAALVSPAPAVAPKHPVADLTADPSKAELEAALVDADKLHNEPEFATWAPERAVLQDLVAKVGERLTGADVENRDAVDKVLEDEAGAATDRYFTQERREAFAIRLRDAAISIRARRGDELARRVLVVAESIRRAGLVTDAPRENAFLRAFFQKGMAMMARESQGRFGSV